MYIILVVVAVADVDVDDYDALIEALRVDPVETTYTHIFRKIFLLFSYR